MTVPIDYKSPKFVKYWSAQYSDNAGTIDYLYNKHLYPGGIENKKFEKVDIEELYRWFYLPWRYACLKGPVLNSKILPKIDMINKFKADFKSNDKNNGMTLRQFNIEFSNVSARSKIFLLHIITPQKFPMFNSYVFRAYIILDHDNPEISEALPSSNDRKEEIYWQQYIQFFNKVAKNAPITQKKLKRTDEALWVFGKIYE